MKLTALFNLFIVGLVLMFGTTACKKNPKSLTHIPYGSKVPTSGGPDDPFNTKPTLFDPNDPDRFEQPPRPGWTPEQLNREMFAANTVYFDTDSSAVKSSEQGKLEAVANYFRSNPAGDLLIEGHCDERGTEGYNSALGDKRANSLREYLANLGVAPSRIHTLSLGEAEPAVPENNEAAWAKNRRGVFIFVEPK